MIRQPNRFLRADLSMRPGQRGDSMAGTGLGRFDPQLARLPGNAGRLEALRAGGKYVESDRIREEELANVRRERARLNQRVYTFGYRPGRAGPSPAARPGKV